MEPVYLHLDMNNFYASVECAERPELRDAPVAVAGDPEKRHGIVLAKNQTAKVLGVKTGDTLWEARLKAPDIVFLPPHFDKYDKISKRMFGICNNYTCYVEPFGPDECWLDCTETVKLFGSGEAIADVLRERVHRELGITASVGVSFTKMFAKLGSDMKKPNGTTVISRDDYRKKVWPLSAADLCGVGKRTYEKLQKINVATIGDLARVDERVIGKILGKPGIDLRKIARGESYGDVREAVVGRDAKSVGHGLTVTHDMTTWDEFTALIYYLSELISARLRKGRVRARGISVCARTCTLSRSGRQTTLPFPVNSSEDIAEAAVALLRTFYDGEPLRSIDVATFMLSPVDTPRQLSFFDDGAKSIKSESLDKAVEKLRLKYGKEAVVRASRISQDLFTDKDVGDFLPFKR